MRGCALGVMASAAMMAVAPGAMADEVRVRFVERVGDVDVVIEGDIMGPSINPVRIRVQMGLFDSATGPALAGGWWGGSTARSITSIGWGSAHPGGWTRSRSRRRATGCRRRIHFST